MVRDNIKQWKLLQENLKYVAINSVPMHEVASAELQDVFDQLTVDAGLTINNKKAQYLPFEEKSNVIKAQYDLALSGQYLPLVSYLEMLYGKNMLYKINSLSLKAGPKDTINIRINLESLYEVN